MCQSGETGPWGLEPQQLQHLHAEGSVCARRSGCDSGFGCDSRTALRRAVVPGAFVLSFVLLLALLVCSPVVAALQCIGTRWTHGRPTCSRTTPTCYSQATRGQRSGRWLTRPWMLSKRWNGNYSSNSSSSRRRRSSSQGSRWIRTSWHRCCEATNIIVCYICSLVVCDICACVPPAAL